MALANAVRLVCRVQGVTFTASGGRVTLQKGKKRMLLNERAWIHAPYAARHFDTFFAAVESSNEDGIQVVDFSKPRLHKFANGLDFEWSGIAEGVESIENYFRWYTPTEGDLVFDLGANCGLIAHRLSSMVGRGRVVCAEPDPANFSLLQRNISRYGLRNVTTLQRAVGASSGRVEFASENAIFSQMSKFLTRETSGDILTVDCCSFEQLCNEFGVPAFVKIDIEGAEIEMLQAALPYLKSRKIHFALDTQHKVDGRYTSRRVEDLFSSIGYETSTENNGMFTMTYARPAGSEAPNP